MNIADLRTTYRRAKLAEDDIQADPFVQFEGWLEQAIAAQALEPTAMTLATVAGDGRPSARIVLLKGFDVAGIVPGASDRGFVWFTNYDSHKGRDLAVRRDAALCFFWPELERQVRIEGRVEKATDSESDVYFASRPLGSRLGAWASPQSEVIASRKVIEAFEREIRERFGGGDDGTLPRPPHWGGYRLVPSLIEFWQGRPSRLHDRIVYRGGDGQWSTARLAP
ncbi:MAG: pyridoxamine 5'-phosphate oxidase [Burkholderiaceae bacterium]